MTEILNMGWPLAAVCIAAILGAVVVWVSKNQN